MQIKEQIPVLRKWIADPPTNGNGVRDMLRDLVGDGTIIFRPAKALPFNFPWIPGSR